MRASVRICALVMFAIAAGTSACALDEEDAEGEVSLAEEERSNDSRAATEPEASKEQDDAELLAGCSVVQFCDVPPGQEFPEDGARCLQQGCSKEAARAECAAETPRICGNPPKCPWYIKYQDGTWHGFCQSTVSGPEQ